MRLLGPDDPLPHPPRRLLVAGASGSGKTTLAGRIGARAGLPHVEIDGLFHGPDWTELPTFRAEVERFSSGPRWVTEWQYSLARPLLAERADTLVWLNHPRALVTWRVTLRTIRRSVSRKPLWNGNRERPLWTVFTERDHIVRWSWREHAKYARRIGELARDSDERSLTIVRLSDQRQVENWLAGPLTAALAHASEPGATA